MAFQCAVCHKGPRAGKSVSHSHKATNRRFLPNLQQVRVLFEGRPQRLLVCSTCIKSNRVQKAA